MKLEEYIMKGIELPTKIDLPLVKFPEFNGNFRKVAEISQCEMSITDSRSPKPILATYGLADCSAFLGYDQNKRVGFLAHIHYLNDTSKTIKNIERESWVRYGNLIFNCGVIGCDSTGLLNTLVKDIRNQNSGSVMFHLSDKDIIHKMIYDTGSVALDTRTGCLYHYSPQRNPNPRAIFTSQILQEMAKADSCKLITV